MIKGVSRQILEVTNTGNPYFERAFFVVKPSFADHPADHLKREAWRVLRMQNGYSGLRRAQRRHRFRARWWRRCGQAALLLLGGMLGILVERIVFSLMS